MRTMRFLRARDILGLVRRSNRDNDQLMQQGLSAENRNDAQLLPAVEKNERDMLPQVTAFGEDSLLT